MDVKATWSFKKKIGKLELNILYSDEPIFLEVIFKDKSVYNCKDKIAINNIADICKSFKTPDEIFYYYRDYNNDCFQYLQYIANNVENIGKKTKGNASTLFAEANKIFQVIHDTFPNKNNPLTDSNNIINQSEQKQEEEKIALIKNDTFEISQNVVETGIFRSYPDFKHDISKLANRFIEVSDNGFLLWIKTMKSLAEYFAYRTYGYPEKERNKKRINWKVIEVAFQVKHLRHHFRPNNKHDKPSDDFCKIMELLNNSRTNN